MEQKEEENIYCSLFVESAESNIFFGETFVTGIVIRGPTIQKIFYKMNPTAKF